MSREHTACPLLGSDLQPEKNLARGVELLEQKVTILRISSVWETPSVGSASPDFLNLALLVTTSMQAEVIKEKVLHPLETQLGRVRGADKDAPRPIDIDIILFDGRQLDLSLWRYAHRAVPVAEIFPNLRSGGGEVLKDVASRLSETTPICLSKNSFINRSSLSR